MKTVDQNIPGSASEVQTLTAKVNIKELWPNKWAVRIIINDVESEFHTDSYPDQAMVQQIIQHAWNKAMPGHDIISMERVPNKKDMN